MGTLRTLFALSVLFGHSYGFVFVGGRNAVQLFYIISGFLISYILVENRSYRSAKSFYINRYLRLYPIYATVAVLSLLMLVASWVISGHKPALFQVIQNAPWPASLLVVVSNLVLFFQDWVMFSAVEGGRLVLTAHYQHSDIPLYEGLIVPQAWTLGVELSFYVIAPFVLTRKKAILALIALSLGIRGLLLRMGLGLSDPWTYRFFPSELALFLLGACAHQFGLPFYRRVLGNHMDRFARGATYGLIAASLSYWLIPLPEMLKTAGLFAIFLALVPLAFAFQAERSWDKWVGDLSYPIYICHVLVIDVLFAAFGRQNMIILSLVAASATIVFAVVLNKLVADPVERIRRRFRSKSVADAIEHPPTLSTTAPA